MLMEFTSNCFHDLHLFEWLPKTGSCPVGLYKFSCGLTSYNIYVCVCRPHASHTNAKYQQISHLNFAVVKILQARLSPSSENPTLRT